MNIYGRRPTPRNPAQKPARQRKPLPPAAISKIRAKSPGSAAARKAARDLYAPIEEGNEPAPGDFDFPPGLRRHGPNDGAALLTLQCWLEYNNMRNANVRYAKIVLRDEDIPF